jgi:hypothetical protein
MASHGWAESQNNAIVGFSRLVTMARLRITDADMSSLPVRNC